MFAVAALAHAGSMFATSFVEEEHQTAYYTVSTLHFFQFVAALRTNWRDAWAPAILLICARVLRSYNQVCLSILMSAFSPFPGQFASEGRKKKRGSKIRFR